MLYRILKIFNYLNGLIVPACGFNRRIQFEAVAHNRALNFNSMLNTWKYFDTLLIFYLVRSVYKKLAVTLLRGEAYRSKLVISSEQWSGQTTHWMKNILLCSCWSLESVIILFTFCEWHFMKLSENDYSLMSPFQSEQVLV